MTCKKNEKKMLGFWMVMEAVVFGVVLRDGLEVTILADRATASARFWVINWLGCGDCALWRLGSGLFIWRSVYGWVSVSSVVGLDSVRGERLQNFQ
jgi:hypothetical protein